MVRAGWQAPQGAFGANRPLRQAEGHTWQQAPGSRRYRNGQCQPGRHPAAAHLARSERWWPSKAEDAAPLAKVVHKHRQVHAQASHVCKKGAALCVTAHRMLVLEEHDAARGLLAMSSAHNHGPSAASGQDGVAFTRHGAHTRLLEHGLIQCHCRPLSRVSRKGPMRHKPKHQH